MGNPPEREQRDPSETIRGAMVHFFQGLDYKTVHESLRETLLNDTISTDQSLRPDKVSYSYIEIERMNASSPPWLNPTLYVSELLKLNSEGLWKRLVDRVEAKQAGTSEKIAKAFGLAPAIRRMVPGVISSSNGRFHGVATVLFGLAGIYGETTEHYVQEDMVDHKSGYIAAIRSGYRFGSVACFGEELLDRLQRLYPENSTEASDSAYQYLLRENAFAGARSGVHCPGVGLTSMHFSAYGSILRDPQYQKAFLQRVQRQQDKLE